MLIICQAAAIVLRVLLLQTVVGSHMSFYTTIFIDLADFKQYFLLLSSILRFIEFMRSEYIIRAALHSHQFHSAMTK